MCEFAEKLLLTLSVLGAVHGAPLKSDTRPRGGRSNSQFTEITSNEHPRLLEGGIDLSFYGSALFGRPDRAFTAAMVANHSVESSAVNPEELGSYLEGDILFPTGDDDVRFRNALTTQSSRWPGAVVPLTINGDFNARDMDTIAKAIKAYHQHTCIRFVPRSTEAAYLSIENDRSGCWSSVGRTGAKQVVNLQSPGCLRAVGTPIHELMHALGFLHEQSRENRDDFVEILYSNIDQQDWDNFKKADETLAFGVPYDYGSVMHYSDHAFSTNGKPTILAKQPDLGVEMGQRRGLSAFDVEKLNQMYCAGDVSPGGYSPESEVPDNLISSFVGGFVDGLVNDRKDRGIPTK